MASSQETGESVRKGQGARPTIGFLTVDIYNSTGQAIWGGVVDAAQRHGVNSICFPEQGMRDSSEFLAQASLLYDLVSAERLDGLLCWTSSVGQHLDAEEKLAFLLRYGLPVVGLTQPLAGIPTVVVDSYQGMREAMSHLIEVHGYRRVAFIRGPEQHPSAKERYQAYLDALEAFEVPFDSGLVTPPGDWTQASGAKGVAHLLDERGLCPGSDFEVVVAVSDIPGLGVLEALQGRGIRVPEDVALVGFNDSPEGRVVTPPLTSVAMPFHEHGAQGVETLLALLAGEEVPEQMTLLARLVVRQSCGCQSRAVSQAAVRPWLAPQPVVGDSLELGVGKHRQRILDEMVQALGEETSNSARQQAQLLMDTFVDVVGAGFSERSQSAFMSAVDDVLRQLSTGEGLAAAGKQFDPGRAVEVWQEPISVLRREMSPYLVGEIVSHAEALWDQTRVMIGEMAWQVQAYQALQVEQQSLRLQGVEASLVTTYEVAELMDVLFDGLPDLDIPGAYVSLYERRPELAKGGSQEPMGWSRLVLAFGDGGRVELAPEGMSFPSKQLVPQELWPQKARSYVAVPLHFQKYQIGFALFAVGTCEGRVYQVLAEVISSALYGALLLQARAEAKEALGEAYAEVERQVRERTAQLEHEMAERERAQAENLQLQQEMIEAQQRAIQELSTPVIPVVEGVIVMPLIGSIDTLRARDITRRLLEGIREHRAQVVILDLTGVPIVDSGVANHLNKTVQAARLKGARTIVTGMTEAVAETVVDLGLDWSRVETMRDLQTGLRIALAGIRDELLYNGQFHP